MSNAQSADFAPLVSREQAGNAIGSALRLFVGRGRRYSVKQLANGTGIKDRMIECAMIDPSSVDYRPLPDYALLSIASFLGAVFTSEWIALAQQGAFDLSDDEEPEPSALVAGMAGHTAAVAAIAADNDFCATDRKTIAAIGHAKIATGQRMVAMGARRARA